ncbi:hypothetical protein V1264_011580 [Littorina saxatilis]|uniref:Choline O-acetyltransferase n=2 Tax=Littorina saxatilis TaxID=31220 RepID=A0AAN9GMI1_9CAEN
MIDNLDFCLLRFDEYGRNFPKSQGVSPDGYIQLALQLTYYKLHGCMAMTYESASIRRFRKGRVDNIRANSPAAQAWVKAMLGETEATTEEKYALFKEAAEWQQKYQIETVLGKGIDCHLLGLREAAAELGVLHSLPFFSDPSFTRINYFQLSTSQVPTTTDSFMCYGPVVPDGYGTCYNPFPEHICVVVTSFYDCADTDSQMFAHSLESSFLQMREICLQGNHPSTS